MANKIIFSRIYFLITILFLSFVTVTLYAQFDNETNKKEYSAEIYSEAFVFESDQPGKGRIDIFIQVPYKEIYFIKDKEQYYGRFEITATLQTAEKQQIWQKNQPVELFVKDFSQTISNRLSSLKQFSVDIAPGKYDLVVQVTDQESKKSTNIRKQVRVKDYNLDSLALSDLMLVHRVSYDDNRKNIAPNLTGIIGKEAESFYIFFEIYNPFRFDSVRLVCKFINSKKEEIVQYEKYEEVMDVRTQVVWKIDTLNLLSDKYVILIEAENYSKTKSVWIIRTSNSRTFSVRLKNLPSTITDIDKATEQLLYIAKGSEIDYIREAKTSDEKLQRFLSFWIKHDPDPKTPANELMEEYYSRVTYADKNFSNYTEGWKSDRGMVFIRFGQPQNVERHPFDSDSKPYEIWYYYDQNREFIFVDDSGFGDYRLRYPTTDLWGRIR